MAIVSFDPSVLINYYAAKLPLSSSQVANSPLQQQTKVTPPWDFSIKKPAQEVEDVASRSSDPYFDPNDKTLTTAANSSSANADSELQAIVSTALSSSSLSSASQSQNPGVAADNDKLFALYKALQRLDYITQMATRDGTVAGQLPGLNQSFQDGLNQILSFVKSTSFNGLTLMPGQKNASVTSSVGVPYPQSYYTGAAVVGDAKALQPLQNVSSNDSFTISITTAGVTTDVPIDLSQVQSGLSLDNIDSYVNSQLAAAGFATRFARVQTGGSILDGSATWGVQVQNSPSEKVVLSSAAAAPAVYVAGSSGLSADSQGKVVKLVGLDSAPNAQFSAAIKPDMGTAQAKSVATDADGNVYVVGNATGSFGNEVNQGTQDVFLTKYDSAGNVQWTKLLGSAGTANGYSVAINPTGGVVVAGSVTGSLTPTSIGGGTDSFVAKYNSEGDQVWLRQTAPLSNDQANSVSVDASGNVYLGGQVAGTIGGGTSAGGQDAYVTKLDSTGKLVYQRQFGTAADDTAARTAIAADGNLVVASIQNGDAILTKYGSGDGTSAPLWQIDLGSLNGGQIGGLTIDGNGKIYVSGTTSNASLNAGGAATIAKAASGGTDAFVFAASDSGASATPDFVSYVGTGDAEKGGGVTVANGEIYLSGTTTGTFAGETRTVQGTHNLFVAQLAANGTLNWTRQYGGLDGESQGAAIAADATGSSVLDALGLKRGLIDENQSSALASQTTVRAGDYFTLQITDSTGTHSARITIGNDETMLSLATKINGALLFDGKAQAYPIKGGQGLKISVNTGIQVQLLAGPKDFDALAGLGLKPQLLVNDSSTNSSSSGNTTSSGNSTASASSTSTSTTQTIGLGLNVGLDLLSKTTAAHAHVVISAAQSLLKQAYSKLNGTGQTTTQAATGPVPGYLQSQIANYQTALDWLNAGGGTLS
ncbi:MAG TPA: hypothetical protein VEU06_03670 [Micropepsaceae bacterium]|nr:hypothetical protein [Micropepsaceae bacterium]